MSEPGNVIPFGPLPVAWLCLPLTQERAARVVQFEEHTGVPILDALIDALDDIIFDTASGRQPSGADDHRPGERAGEARAGEFVSGATSCVQHRETSDGSQSKFLPQSGANAELLPEAGATIQNGSTTRHATCSERTLASNCTSSPDTRSAPATPTRRATPKNGGAHPSTFSEGFSTSHRDSHSMPPSWMAADGGTSTSESLRSAERSSSSQSNPRGND